VTITLIDEAVIAGARIERACDVVGISSRTLERWRKDEACTDRRAGPKRAPAHQLSDTEKEKILDVANSPEFRDKSPKQIVPTLADRGEYIASESSFYRVLRENDQLARRGRARSPSASKPKELVATAPNQIWCWDITYMRAGLNVTTVNQVNRPGTFSDDGSTLNVLLEGSDGISRNHIFDIETLEERPSNGWWRDAEPFDDGRFVTVSERGGRTSPFFIHLYTSLLAVGDEDHAVLLRADLSAYGDAVSGFVPPPRLLVTAPASHEIFLSLPLHDGDQALVVIPVPPPETP
jgi:hypothetical protein